MDIDVILAIVFGIPTLIGLIYALWELMRENERLKKEITTIKEETIEEYPSRDLRKIVELLSKATQEISILGLVGWEPIHEARSIIIDLINNHNGKVRILIANPSSRYFQNRELREKDYVGRLRLEHNSAITELMGILSEINPKKKKNLIIKLYNDLPGGFFTSNSG